MNLYSTSDQARSLTLQLASTTAKHRLNALSQELSSGRIFDLPEHLSGNTRMLRSYEQRLSMLSRFQASAQEAATTTEIAQNILGSINKKVAQIGISLYSGSSSGSASTLSLLARDAAVAFDQAISNLNTQVDSQYIFSGINTDQPPLRPAKEILDELISNTGHLSNSDDIKSYIDDWFDRPPGGGGYIDTAYFGSTGQSRLLPVSENENLTFTVSAATASIRQALKGLAMGAIIDRGALSGNEEQKHKLLRAAGQALMDSRQPISNEQGRLGLLQQRIQSSISANEAEKSLYQLAHSKLTSADPYDTAAALTEAQTRMETIYTLTSHLSNLKLVNYLK